MYSRSPHETLIAARCVEHSLRTSRLHTMESSIEMENDLKHVRVLPPSQRNRFTGLRATAAVLGVVNLMLICALFVVMSGYNKPTPPSWLSSAVFSAQHRHSGITASRFPVAAISTSRMQRSELSYASTPAASYVLAAGVNTIYDESSTATHEVHLEILNGSTFGEFTAANGHVGAKTMQLRFVDLSTGSEGVLIPMSLSLVPGATLVPNMFFFSYKVSASAVPVTTFVSTVQGSYVFQNDVGQTEWNSHMLPALDAYSSAWVADHPQRARALSEFEGWAAGKIGGSFGSSRGGTAGGIAGTALGHMADGSSASSAMESAGWSVAGTVATGLMGSAGGDAVSTLHKMDDGESMGDAAGSTLGQQLGSTAGAAVGADIDGAAGGALGAAVGGPVGAAVGEEVGSFAGKMAGSYVGGKLGSELGGDVGSDIESDADSVGSDIESDWDSATSGW